MNYYDTETRTISEKELKWSRVKRKVINRINGTLEWINQNKEALVIIVPVAVAAFNGGSKIVRGILNNVALAQEKRLKELKIYDRSMGRYIDLKRPLRQSDMKIILERKENGEKLSNILMDLNLLK